MREAWKMDTWCLRVDVYNTLQQWIDTASKDFADKNRLKKKNSTSNVQNNWLLNF